MNTLPDELRYFGGAFAELSALPSEQLNEDVDLTTIETGLRERVKGLTIREATERIKRDCATLKKWSEQLRNSDAAVISFVVGVLSYRPDALARRLLAPIQAAQSEPTIFFDAPDGWSTNPMPLSLHLRAGRSKVGAITVVDDSAFELMAHRNQVRDEKQSQVQTRNPFAVVGEWTRTPVRFGGVQGNKYLYKQTKPVPWKSVQYLLRVPGGAVNITLDASGKEIDESPFENKLHTLRLELNRSKI